jgi:hypothetical protein
MARSLVYETLFDTFIGDALKGLGNSEFVRELSNVRLSKGFWNLNPTFYIYNVMLLSTKLNLLRHYLHFNIEWGQVVIDIY